MDKIVLIGAGGHCKVVIDLLKNAYDIEGVTDIDGTRRFSWFYGVEVLGDDGILLELYRRGVRKALVTVGSTGVAHRRAKLFETARDIGFEMINAISAGAVLSCSVKMGAGNTVMDGAIIHSDTVLGDNVIVNTGSIIEHDCLIGNNVHIAPGARISGGVSVGDGCLIGMGACVIQGVKIGRDSVIGAGSVVIRDIPPESTAVGVPAKVIRTGI